MRIVIDIEADALVNPTNIWLIVCRDIDTGTYYKFRKVTEDEEVLVSFRDFWKRVSLVVGHNWLGYDWPVLVSLLGFADPAIVEKSLDTLILSKLIDYSRQGHSIEDYGLEFGIPKGKFVDFSKYSQEMEDYCVRDVDICHRIYLKYLRYINNPDHRSSITLEHQFQLVVNDLHSNGFCFNTSKAQSLLAKVESDLAVLDKDILEAFPPRLKLVREITPKATKYGTISLTSIPKAMRPDIECLNIDSPFSYCEWETFNPSSHKQIVRVLSEANWSPVDRTQTHIDTERELGRLKYSKGVDLRKKELIVKLTELKKSGWKVNEANLETLPSKAPAGARTLAKRILLEARRRTLTEWLGLVWHEIEIEHGLLQELGIAERQQTLNGSQEKEVSVENGSWPTQTRSEKITKEIISSTATDCPSKTLLKWLKSKKVDATFVKKNASSTSITVIGQDQLENFSAQIATATSVGLRNSPPKYKIISSRIHGRFQGLGAWSHRMSHQNPNTANIPNEFDTAGKKKLLGKELRSLWQAPRNRLLVGVDAEGIQLRIFAHLINDPEFTRALVEGKKDDKTDPHSLNQSILGSVCKSRAAAKRFIYALLLGAGMGKLSEILGCSDSETKEALDRLMGRYVGWQLLKDDVFPKDAKRGWFTGLDGRRVRIPGDTEGSRRHLAMSGYLQNGEAVVMKRATLKWVDQLKTDDAILVNFVHDEWQTEVPNNMEVALRIARMQADSLRIVGEELKLHCPLAGSYWNDDHHDYTIATNWSATH